MRLVTEGEIILKWSDGHTVSLGTIGIEADKAGNVAANMKAFKKFRQKVGWDIVRVGFLTMMPGRRWKTTYK